MKPLEYALWFGNLNGIDIDADFDYSMSREIIEEQVMNQKKVSESEEPSEEMTEEVFKATSEEEITNEGEGQESGEVANEEKSTAVSGEAAEDSGASEISSQDIPNTDNFPESLSYDAMTVKELKEECKSRGLPVYGTKAELALRLKRYDEGISESTTETETPADAAVEEKSDIPADEAAMTNGETNEENSGEQEPVNAK